MGAIDSWYSTQGSAERTLERDLVLVSDPAFIIRLVASFAVGASAVAFAEEAREDLVETTAEQIAAQRGFEIVGTVRSVRQFRGTGWQYVSDRALILSVGAAQDYLVELVGPCRGLRSAEGILTTTTGNELTTFDAVIAPDSPMGGIGCPIRTIHQLKRLPKSESPESRVNNARRTVKLDSVHAVRGVRAGRDRMLSRRRACS